MSTREAWDPVFPNGSPRHHRGSGGSAGSRLPRRVRAVAAALLTLLLALGPAAAAPASPEDLVPPGAGPPSPAGRTAAGTPAAWGRITPVGPEGADTRTLLSLGGGTSLLIVVGVALDTLQQIDSHLLMRHYDGLMRSGRLKGRRRM